MFDDLLSATALIGVAGVLATAVTSLATDPARPVSAAGPPGATLATAGPPASAASMPIHDLPRVVVTGHRLRDGDMLADGSDRARSAGGPR